MSRFDYVKFDEVAQQQQNNTKEKAQDLESAINALGPSRYSSLALTALEECYAWIGKAIRDGQIARNGKAEIQP